MEEFVFLYPKRILNATTDEPKEEIFKSYYIKKQDKKILRELAQLKAEYASSDKNEKSKQLWKKLNNLNDVKPLIWINEIPWHEMDVNNELKLITQTHFSRYLEIIIRRSLYYWRHLKVDNVMEASLPCYKIVKDAGLGVKRKEDTVRSDILSNISSKKFINQFKNENDLQKIKKPSVRYNKNETEKMYESMLDVFHDILSVEIRGIPGFCFSPWDELVMFYGVQDALTDLMLKPKFIQKIIEKLTNFHIAQIELYENLNLLTLNNSNYRIGSGGLGYTDELPQKDFDPKKIRSKDLWGCCTAQIFAAVSPKMHLEFALNYEIQYMKKFGLNYYGCCEPLDMKIDILRTVPNLRKISMSPWANIEDGAEKIGKDFVFSYKPNPAIFAQEEWDIKEIKKDFKNNISKIRRKNCILEVIMKDISTVRYKPQRLWDWSKIAMEIAEEL